MVSQAKTREERVAVIGPKRSYSSSKPSSVSFPIVTQELRTAWFQGYITEESMLHYVDAVSTLKYSYNQVSQINIARFSVRSCFSASKTYHVFFCFDNTGCI